VTVFSTNPEGNAPPVMLKLTAVGRNGRLSLEATVTPSLYGTPERIGPKVSSTHTVDGADVDAAFTILAPDAMVTGETDKPRSCPFSVELSPRVTAAAAMKWPTTEAEAPVENAAPIAQYTLAA
jgi:hypothetical protein